ncbi:MAG: response regulator transcription factor [Sideroxydans sp.]|nr:response regulator transcription factor [Sideroxydans sp.]
MKTALLLEDLPESQVVLIGVMQTAFSNIRIGCESSVSGALALVSQYQFDLALIDLSLPDGDGTSVIEVLASHNPKCMIVVATIFDDDEHLFPALRAGAQGYLLKDQPTDQLVNQLRGISEGHPPLSPAIARRLLDHFRTESEQSLPLDRAEDATLSVREREVLMQLARGLSVSDIALLMKISRHTVGDHVKSIYKKLNISSRAEAAIRAKGMGLL